ncbi:MAG: lysophospholipid acyltransferase family protein [Candidatus Omnitrophota bacterium]|nr:lysophospholipid acyltransferase family protein [Candidatus Omnitrophota bacterium]
MPLYHIFRFILILLFKIIFGLEVIGVENIPRRVGFILASNHLSNLDPLILGVACIRELNFMAKEDLFRNSFFSSLLDNVGAFPVRRDYVDVSAIKEAISRLKSGAVVLVFPEGTRGRSEDQLQVQLGVALLANKANCPILPAFITGADKAMPRGSKFIKPTKITVRFGRLLSFDKNQTYEQIANKVGDEIISLKV